MKLKEKIVEDCTNCGAVELGIFYVNGGLEKFCLHCNHSLGRLIRLENNQFIMPFGKHKGTLISDLPKDYLTWGSENLTGAMKKRFKEELTKKTKNGEKNDP